MAGYSRYQNPRNAGRRRDRNGRGNPPAEDAVVSMITMQVILCIALILSLTAYKSINPEGYSAFKSEYSAMTSGDNQPEGTLLSGIYSGITGAADTVRDFFAGLIPGAFRDDAEAPPAEIIQEEAQPPTEAEEEARHAFQYDYLKDDDVTAMGGMYPYGDGINLPEEATMTPVFVGGYVRPPVSGEITSGFGYREHPITMNQDFHTGMDIAAPEGSPVLSALPGIVSETGESDIYGNYVTLSHGDGFYTFYGHCSQVFAAQGMVLRQGERIAKVGSIGASTGPHLHFSVIVRGKYTDPYWVLKDDIIRLEPDEQL